MIIKKHILIYFLLLGLNGFAQNDESQFKAWRLTALSGQLNLKGNYRETNSLYNNFSNAQSEAYMNGILQLRTQSYFVHPNFMTVNLNGIYNPETRRSYYLDIPDFTEKSVSEGADLSVLFFKNKNFNLSTTASIYSTLQNIENLTRVKGTSKYLGAAFSYNNRILPFTFDYFRQQTEQRTIGLPRSFNLDQRFYQGVLNKSFSNLDHHSLSYLHTENTSYQNDVGYVSTLRAFNKTNIVQLNDQITFGRKRNCSFSSAISNSDEYGTFNYNSQNVQENFTIGLPKNFSLSNDYSYWKTKYEFNKVNYQSFQSTLSHHLFESLNSRLMYAHWVTDQTYFREEINKAGIDLRYQKRIRNGKLGITYSYYRENHTVTTPPTTIGVVHEACTLVDNQMTLLKNVYVDIQSIVVRDVTGNTVYQLNLDYIIIDKTPYVEIVRVPGGLIANNTTVYVDYTARKPGLNEFISNNHNFGTNVYLLKNILNLYYSYSSQYFTNQVQSENLVLNVFTSQIVGFRLDFHFISGGIEYQYSRSNVIPFHGMKYYLSYQKMYRKLNFNLNANLTDFQMTNEDARRKDLNLQTNLAYSILPNVKITLDYMYRSMKGRGIDLNVHTSKLDITATVHSLFVSLGSELYWSTSENVTSSYKGLYIQITRYF